MSVNDYLSELCKEDNVDVNEYLSKQNNERQLEERKEYPSKLLTMKQDALLNPKMTYTFWDRIYAVWIQLKLIREGFYDPFDFHYYSQTGSTPLGRFFKFVKHQWVQIKWAWQYTPAHIDHYKKNEGRITKFEGMQNDMFENDEKKQILGELGYMVETNYIYYDNNPSQEKI